MWRMKKNSLHTSHLLCNVQEWLMLTRIHSINHIHNAVNGLSITIWKKKKRPQKKFQQHFFFLPFSCFCLPEKRELWHKNYIFYIKFYLFFFKIFRENFLFEKCTFRRGLLLLIRWPDRRPCKTAFPAFTPFVTLSNNRPNMFVPPASETQTFS